MSTTNATRILEILGPACRDDRRRQRLLELKAPNGIDFVEYEQVLGKHILHVHFLEPLPADAYTLVAKPSHLRVHGGTRIVNIEVVSVSLQASLPHILDVEVDAQGDFSPYLLTVGWTSVGEAWTFEFTGIDRLFSVAPINFRPSCPVDFDCLPTDECTKDLLAEPMLDYLARDYASFRQLLIDLVAQRNPSWTERSPADLGMTLLELFAHEGDHQSYFQDAVANEAYLDTARQRVSARRHARLVDYPMHDGRNAWAYVHLQCSSDGELPAGSQLATKIRGIMRFDRDPNAASVLQPSQPPGVLLHPVLDEDWRSDPALAQVRVFETTQKIKAHSKNNELRLHTWGNHSCCLPRGATSAHVYAIDDVTKKADRPVLASGDLLLLEEVRSPTTGAAADADPAHRQVVRIIRVNPDLPDLAKGIHDPLFLRELDSLGELRPVSLATLAEERLPLLEITWAKEDALTFSLCLSAEQEKDAYIRCSVARGNIVYADHGRSTSESYLFSPPLDSDSLFRLHLEQGPLTMQAGGAPDGMKVHQPDPRGPASSAVPAIALSVATGANTAWWWPVPDLLNSDEFDRNFVAEIANDGRGVLRFGDGEYGARLSSVDKIDVWYRVGNGRGGNVGAEAIAHLIEPDPGLKPEPDPNLPPPPPPDPWPIIESVRNPLPARDGADAESIEAVRQYAPAAFRASQLRAVTEEDYRNAALTISGVAGAVANFRWTGSWYTVFIGIDPDDQNHVLTNARGVTRLHPDFRSGIHAALTRYRLAGYDLEIRSARYVPLDVELHVCVKRGYFRGDVVQAVAVALGATVGPGGVTGLFHPASFTFGQSVHLSHIYARVVSLAGVESARVTTFHRHGRPPNNELESGRLEIGPWEIARLDNSRSNMENGTLTITSGGGS